MQHRVPRREEYGVIAWPPAVPGGAQIEARRRIQGIEQRGEFTGGPGAKGQEARVPEPPHHVEVEHRVQRIDGLRRRVLHEVGRTECAQLLTAEGHQHDRTSRLAVGELAPDLQKRRRARRVVVGAIVHPARGIGIERAKATEPQVVVMRAHQDDLPAQRA